jgi:pyruvate kinase
MSYTILATLGPATPDEPAWNALLAAGATGFRLNTSHLSRAQLDEWLARLNDFCKGEAGREARLSAKLDASPLQVALDLQGSKWRLGAFAPFELTAGRSIELILAESATRQGVLPVPHTDFFRAASASNGEIVLNDAKSRLMLESAAPDRLTARVILPGEITPRKGITFAAADFRIEAISEKDQAILQQTDGLDFVRYAISYVKDAAEMATYRRFCPGKRLIAKLERQPAVNEAARIAEYADELWLCRGDLGAELGLPGMAAAAHQFALNVHGLPIPSLLAGQVLEHMASHPTPTRSEICALHDALRYGYTGVVLSDETVVGRYPIESVRTAALFV